MDLNSNRKGNSIKSSLHPAQYAMAKKICSVLLMGPEPNDDVYELSAHLFTPEEAQIARYLPFYLPLRPGAIALLARRPLKEVRARLRDMAEKRVIFGYKNWYLLMPIVPGIFEYMMMKGGNTSWHVKYVQIFTRLFQKGYVRRYTQDAVDLPSIRYVPVNTSIENNQHIVDYDFMMEAIDKHTDMAILNYCQCRFSKALIGGEPCRHGSAEDGCMWFGLFARWAVQDGSARMVSKDEMRTYVREKAARDYAFMTLNLAPHNNLMVCLCCKCCCHIFEAINDFGGKMIVAPSMYLVQSDRTLCTDCGVCAKNCHTHAHRMEDKKHSYDPSLCVGCGACIAACKKNALCLVKNPDYKPPYRNPFHVGVGLMPPTMAIGFKLLMRKMRRSG